VNHGAAAKFSATLGRTLRFNPFHARPKIALAIASHQAIINSHQEHLDHKEASPFPLPSCSWCSWWFQKTQSAIRLPNSNAFQNFLNSTYFVPSQIHQPLQFKAQTKTPLDKTTEFCPKTWDPWKGDKIAGGRGCLSAIAFSMVHILILVGGFEFFKDLAIGFDIRVDKEIQWRASLAGFEFDVAAQT